jgi:heme exporter protein B
MSNRPAPSALQQFMALLHKDALIEWRSRARLNAVIFFAVLTVLLFSFSVGPQVALLGRLAPGFFWLSVLLASVLALAESMRVETDSHAMEGLLLLPVDPATLFLAKSCSSSVFLSLLGWLLLPICVALYGASLRLPHAVGWFALVNALGAGAISAPGTLYAALSMQARARDILLPLLLFPILIPGLVAAVKTTTLIMQGDPMGEFGIWMALLVAFNVVYWGLCACLFGRVVQS